MGVISCSSGNGEPFRNRAKVGGWMGEAEGGGVLITVVIDEYTRVYPLLSLSSSPLSPSVIPPHLCTIPPLPPTISSPPYVLSC